MDYKYQEIAAQSVLGKALGGNYIASILAACPSAGKTTISHIIINKYLQHNPYARIVVLTEGQNTLKNQYLDELNDANVTINFNYGGLVSDAQVRVGLPQSIHTLNWSTFDLLIVDEAHNFYLAKTIQQIIKTYKPTHQILMTGSPTKYNKHNQINTGNQFGIHYISADELKKQGLFSGVDIDVLKVYNQKDPEQVITSILNKAQKANHNLSKIMVACPTIRYAIQACEILKKMGRNVCLSTSKNDPNDEQIKNFKAGVNGSDTLVVVNRGLLGFNDPSITLLMDLRSSSNLDASYQLFARILRTHPDGIRKAYYRVASADGFNKQVLSVHKMVSLMDSDIFRRYNGSNLKLAS